MGLRALAVVLVQQAGDAEIEQLGVTFPVHQDVRRLDVAMHDQLPVRMVHGIAGLCQQFHATRQRCTLRVAPGGDVIATHQLHRQPGLAGIVDAAIQQLRDVRVLQSRQHLPLAHEARGQRCVTGPDALDRHVLLERAIDAACAEHFAHPALADALEQLVGTDALVERRVAQVVVRHPRQQGFHPRPQFRLDASQRRFACRCLHVQQVADQAQGALFEGGVGRGHARVRRCCKGYAKPCRGMTPPMRQSPSRSFSHARAAAQSRYTVRSSSSSIAATSATLRPMK